MYDLRMYSATKNVFHDKINYNQDLEGELVFSLDDKIEFLPDFTTHHTVEDKHLVIAPDLARWIVVSALGYEIFTHLQQGYSIYQTIMYLNETSKVDTELLMDEMSGVIRELIKANFFTNIQTTIKRPRRKIILHLTKACNLSCTHCYVEAGKALQNELTTLDWKNVIDQFVKLNIDNQDITFTGGEPLLLPDILEIFKQVKRNGLNVKLLTNGTMFRTFEETEKIMQYVDTIQISLDGATREVHDKVRGKGSFDQTMQAIDFLKKLGRKFRIAITLMQDNINDLEENIIHLYEKLEGDSLEDLGFSYIFPTGRALQKGDNGSFKDYFEVERNLYKQLETLGYQEFFFRELQGLKTFSCDYGYWVVVKPDGNVYACETTNKSYGNVRDGNFVDIVNSMEHLFETYSVDTFEECKKCDLKYICGGGCREKNYVHNNDITTTYCPAGFKEKYYFNLVRS